jgi:hypothetical protein
LLQVSYDRYSTQARCEGSAVDDANDVIFSLVRLEASHDLEPAWAAISRGASIHLFVYLNGSIDGCAIGAILRRRTNAAKG